MQNDKLLMSTLDNTSDEEARVQEEGIQEDDEQY